MKRVFDAVAVVVAVVVGGGLALGVFLLGTGFITSGLWEDPTVWNFVEVAAALVFLGACLERANAIGDSAKARKP